MSLLTKLIASAAVAAALVAAMVSAMGSDTEQGWMDRIVGPMTVGWKGGVGDHLAYTVLLGLAPLLEVQAHAFGLRRVRCRRALPLGPCAIGFEPLAVRVHGNADPVLLGPARGGILVASGFSGGFLLPLQRAVVGDRWYRGRAVAIGRHRLRVGQECGSPQRGNEQRPGRGACMATARRGPA